MMEQQGFLDKVVQDLVDKINDQKVTIVKQKLEAIGLGDLLKDIDKKRFKPIVVEIRGEEEIWYANDGSNEGKRIVTFRNKQPDSVIEEGETFKMFAELQYY